MFFVIPKTANKVLFLNLHNGETASIFELTKNVNELPKEIIDSCDFFDYLDKRKTVVTIKLEDYLNYENLDPYLLYICNLTKDFIKYTIEEATKEADKIIEKLKCEDEELMREICQKPLDEDVFRMAKEYDGDIFYAIENHNNNCEKLGFKTYVLNDYKFLLQKYGFIKEE